LPQEIATTAPPPPPGVIEPQVEYLIKATGIDFRIGGNRAFHVPTEDYVQVPPPQAYFEPINWHRTALHELTRMPAAIRHVLIATCRAALVPRSMRLRNWLRKSRLRSVARRSVSCPRFGTPHNLVERSCGAPRGAKRRKVVSATRPGHNRCAEAGS